MELKRDEDVLDTWFSSGLWPFATLGWPKKTPEVEKFYPTSVLVTGFDIIFFWVARMIMMGTEFLKEEPFKKIYVHALVRDEKGQKMSKSKGNVIDPLELIEKYSADALRFTLLSMASPGRDVKLSEDRVKGYRNFLNKIWNANNFLRQNECDFSDIKKPENLKLTINKWILSELVKVKNETENSLKNYRFDEAAKNIYQFVWHSFCDWYLELSKTVFNSKNEEDIKELRQTSAYVFKEILIILHPFIPFVTEEIWLNNKLDKNGGEFLMHANWLENDYHEKKSYDEINNIINFITSIRSFKNELNISPGSFIEISTENTNKEYKNFLSANENILKKNGRIKSFHDNDLKKSSASIVINGELFKLYFDEDVDLNMIKSTLEKKIKKISEEMKKIDVRLSKKSFVDRAPQNIVEQEKSNFANLKKDVKKIELTLKGL